MSFKKKILDPSIKSIKRTIKLDLHVSPNNEIILNSTINSYTQCFNIITAFGWSNNSYNKISLQKNLYYTLKDKSFPKCSQLVISSLSKASESLKSAFALRQKRQDQIDFNTKTNSTKYKIGRDISCPVSKSQSIRYDSRSMSITLNSKSLSLLTLEGRIDLDFSCNKYYSKYLNNELFLQDFKFNWKFGSADLVKSISYKNKKPITKWSLNLSVSSDIPLDQFKKSNNYNIVGVDLGINQPMVDSLGNFYGNSKLWKEIDNNYLRVRKELQSKGTKSAKKRFKAISGRQRRFHKDCNHCLSKSLISKLNTHDIIVMEELKDIRQTAKARKSVRKLLNNWGFYQLKTFIKYKAEGKLIEIVEVNPKNTSRRCNECGHVAKANRSTQEVFSCKGCGFTENADLNAARNIRDKYIGELSKVRGEVNHPDICII